MINICADKEFVEFLKYFETFYNQKYLSIYFSIQKMPVDTILCTKNYLWKHFATRKISGNVFHTKNVWEDIFLYETCSWRHTSVWEMSVETFCHTRHVYIFEKYIYGEIFQCENIYEKYSLVNIFLSEKIVIYAKSIFQVIFHIKIIYTHLSLLRSICKFFYAKMSGYTFVYEKLLGIF